jgi:hypothetical protein
MIIECFSCLFPKGPAMVFCQFWRFGQVRLGLFFTLFCYKFLCWEGFLHWIRETNLCVLITYRSKVLRTNVLKISTRAGNGQWGYTEVAVHVKTGAAQVNGATKRGRYRKWGILRESWADVKIWMLLDTLSLLTLAELVVTLFTNFQLKEKSLGGSGGQTRLDMTFWTLEESTLHSYHCKIGRAPLPLH